MKSLSTLCIFAVVICAIQVSSADDIKEKYLQLQATCIEKAGTTKEVVQAAREGTYADDDKLAAYFKCMFVKVGFMCADGLLHPDVMLEKAKLRMDETKAKTIIDKCVAQAHDDAEKKAYEMFKCFRDAHGESITVA